MTGRKGLIFLMEWLIVADQTTALMSGCFSGFCFVSTNLESEWRSRDYAEQWCSSNNGTQLIEITRADIQTAMSSYLNSINGANLYSGRTLFTAGKRDAGSWTWVARKSPSSLYIDTPSDLSYAYGYLQLQTTSRITLTASRPTDAKQGYICEDGSQCTDNGVKGVLLNSRCYRSYSNEVLSWYDARSRCLDKGGDLASFDFITQDQGLSALNGSWLTPTNTYWLGLRREWWTWKVSQSDVKYSYWSAGDHPRTLSNDPSDCLCLEPSQWRWLECRCGEAKPLICFSEIRSSTTTTTTTTTTVTTSTTTTPKSTTTPILVTSPTTYPSLSNESIRDVASTISNPNPTENPLLTASDGVSSVPTTAAAAVVENKHKEGLDRDIAIGIGVGVGGGVVVVILVVVVAVIIIRKRSNRSTPEKKEKTKKVKKLQTPDIIALQTTTTNNQEENPYVTVIRLPDIGETSVFENATSDKPETIYADLEFLTRSSLTDNTSADVVSETGSSRPSSPSRLAEADVEVDHIDYNADQYTTATCATFL